jgi:hypothetical protein
MSSAAAVPELWEWAEYYCPWCYIAAVRLHHVLPEYQDRVRLRVRPYPLEVMGGEAAPRAILEQEWWLAAIPEWPPARSRARRGDPGSAAVSGAGYADADAGRRQQAAASDRVRAHA